MSILLTFFLSLLTKPKYILSEMFLYVLLKLWTWISAHKPLVNMEWSTMSW